MCVGAETDCACAGRRAGLRTKLKKDYDVENDVGVVVGVVDVVAPVRVHGVADASDDPCC